MRCSLRSLAGVAIFCWMVCLSAFVSAQQPPATPIGSQAAAKPNIAPGKALPAADDLYASMLASLESHQSIAARVRHRIDLFNHQLVGSGIYLQQSLSPGQSRGSDRLLRYELKMQVDNQVTSLQQISDGKFLWTHQNLLGKQTLQQIDLARLQRALAAQEKPIHTSPTVAWIALGGLPKLIKSLADWYYFESVEEGKLDRFPVLILRGQLHNFHLITMLPGQKERIEAGQKPELEKIPVQVPSRVVLMIGREDLFPYRIEWWHLTPGEKKPLTLKRPPMEDRLVLAVEFFEVQLDVPQDPRQFIYNPGESQPTDVTTNFLQTLRLKEAVEIKSTSSKSSGRR